MDFNITSHKCCIEQVRLSGLWAQGQGHCGYFKKHFVIALAHTFIDGFSYDHTNVGYDNISSKFDFQGPGHKVKVTLAIFRKKNIIALVPTFIDGF